MIDLHTHLLPCMDDGSKSVEESLALLRLLRQQGVTLAAATPHFYAERETPQQFLLRRQEAIKRLQDVWVPDLPALLCGAETAYYRGISRMEELSELCIGEKVLLLEMPFQPWSNYSFEEILSIRSRGFDVVLAHVERYFSIQDRRVWQQLFEHGVKMQTNAGALLHWQTEGGVLRMIRSKKIGFLASDCHNLTTRPPRMDEAASRLQKKLGSFEAEKFLRGQEDWLRERCEANAVSV